MSNNDALLFVGYEPSTGAVLSVGGVTVLGIRDAHTPHIVSAKKKFASGSGEYEKGFAKGYALCKTRGGKIFDLASGEWVEGDVPPMLTVSDFDTGFAAGWLKCRREMRLTQGKPLTIEPAGLLHYEAAPASQRQPVPPNPVTNAQPGGQSHQAAAQPHMFNYQR